MRRKTVKFLKRYAQYLEARAKYPGISSAQALVSVRAQEKRKTRQWTLGAGSDRAEFHRGGFDVVARIKNDDDGDSSYLGTFTDKWEPGAIPRGRWDDVYKQWHFPSREYKYYVSSNHPDVMKEARELNRDYGRSKHAAYLEVLEMRAEEKARLEDRGEGWGYSYVVVKVFRKGIELGQASCGGIESDSDAEHFEEIADDLVSEAISDARKALEALCS